MITPIELLFLCLENPLITFSSLFAYGIVFSITISIENQHNSKIINTLKKVIAQIPTLCAIIFAIALIQATAQTINI